MSTVKSQSLQMQLYLYDDKPTVEDLLARNEDQWFDRKSIRIEARHLADVLLGFANADGGRIVVGVHNGEIEGVDASPKRINDDLQATLDFSSPPVRHSHLLLDCTNRNGQPDHLLILDVEASETIHRNQKQECFLRVGDENRLLSRSQERELAFDKGESVFDSTLVPGLIRDDLDIPAVEDYVSKLSSSSVPTLLRSRRLFLDYPHRTGVTQAGWLLFGLQPPIWSYVRYLRYTGTVAETGIRSNIVEDVRLEGTIPSIIENTRLFLLARLETVIRLTSGGRFEPVPVLPEFAWLEAIVNAVTHRSYSLQGDGVRVREFDDRLEVESPGRLPGLVRIQNIQNMRFSRNPHIARVLAEMTGYVRELNEGIPRMFEEMERYGLRPPIFYIGEGNVRVTLYKQQESIPFYDESEIQILLAPLRRRMNEETTALFLSFLIANRQLSSRDIAAWLNVAVPTARSYMKILESAGLVTMSALSRNAPNASWAITESPFWKNIS